MGSAQSIQDVLSKLEDAAENADTLSIDDVMSTFGRKAYGPIIVLVGLISLSPIGSIPGASVFFGAVLMLLMIQFLAVDRAPWLPKKMRDLAVDADRAKKSIDRVRPYAERFGNYLKPRMERFVERPWNYVAAVLVLGMSLTFLPLAVVPWGVAPPSIAIAFIGLALVSHDGLAMLIALGVSVTSLALTAWLLL